MHEEIEDLEVIGMPCNQFGRQEPWEEDDILRWTEERFGRRFALTEKLDMNGPNTHPLAQYLKDKTDLADVNWNFKKFLVGRDGVPRQAFSTSTPAKALVPIIETLLKEKA